MSSYKQLRVLGNYFPLKILNSFLVKSLLIYLAISFFLDNAKLNSLFFVLNMNWKLANYLLYLVVVKRIGQVNF